MGWRRGSWIASSSGLLRQVPTSKLLRTVDADVVINISVVEKEARKARLCCRHAVEVGTVHPADTIVVPPTDHTDRRPGEDWKAVTAAQAIRGAYALLQKLSRLHHCPVKNGNPTSVKFTKTVQRGPVDTLPVRVVEK